MDAADTANKPTLGSLPSSLPVLDLAVLAELRVITGRDDAALQISFIDQYLATAPEGVNAMAKSAELLERETLRRLAHTLNATSAYVGAARVRELAHQLERAALKAAKEELLNRVTAIRSELQPACSALDEIRRHSQESAA